MTVKRAIFSVSVGGTDITGNLTPFLIDLSVTDKDGQSSDSASIEIDDTDGRIILPRKGDKIRIALGWEEDGKLGTIFVGTIDEVRAKGGRGGRTVSISASGMDTSGKAKQGQRRHFDDTTIEDALSAAGQFAGVSVSVDSALASIRRPYIALDDESFVAFGERLARELGGTFKIVGDQAVLAKRNAGRNPKGEALPTVTARWGVNLHDYDVTPLQGRPSERETLTRFYDVPAARWRNQTAETGTEGGITTKPARFTEPDQSRATEQSEADAAEADRKSGEGSVKIEGTLEAQPEGVCIIADCRPGVDGTYRIESVEHHYSRSGWTTSLSLRQPKGAAGKDNR